VLSGETGVWREEEGKRCGDKRYENLSVRRAEEWKPPLLWAVGEEMEAGYWCEPEHEDGVASPNIVQVTCSEELLFKLVASFR